MMYETLDLLSRGWDIALGTWPLLAVATLLWLVMLVTALRRISAGRPGGFALAMMAGGWAIGCGLALQPSLAQAALAKPAAGASLLLLGLAAGAGLLRARASAR